MEAITQQLIPVAILTNVAWGYMNLSSETKDNWEKGWMWVLAALQLVMMGFALFNPFDKKVMLGIMLGLSVLAGFLTWFRFKSSKTARVLYIISQALANSLYVVNYAMSSLIEKKKVKLEQTYFELETATEIINKQEKYLKDTEQRFRELKNKVVKTTKEGAELSKLQRARERSTNLLNEQKEARDQLELKSQASLKSLEGTDLEDITRYEEKKTEPKEKVEPARDLLLQIGDRRKKNLLDALLDTDEEPLGGVPNPENQK